VAASQTSALKATPIPALIFLVLIQPLAEFANACYLGGASSPSTIVPLPTVRVACTVRLVGVVRHQEVAVHQIDVDLGAPEALVQASWSGRACS
jgi:hypothetical protein